MGRGIAAGSVVVVALALVVVVLLDSRGSTTLDTVPERRDGLAHDEGHVASALQPGEVVARDSVRQGGLRVRYSARPLGGDQGATTISRGGFADIALSLTHAGTGRPFTHGRPIVWVDSDKTADPGGGARLSCDQKMRLYAQGTFGFQPEIDLSSYYILAMNSNASISVIDPLGGVQGISQLYAMIDLTSPAADWAWSADGSRIYVTMPRAGLVAVVDTDTFTVVANVDAEGAPVRAVLEPGGHRLWVTTEGTDEDPGGVTVIDTHHLEAVGHVATGAGPHDIVFPQDPEGDGTPTATPPHEHGSEVTTSAPDYAFVTNRDSGTLSVVDARTLENVRDLDVGTSPVALDYAVATRSVYVAGQDGSITAVDASTADVTARLRSSAGLVDLQVAPGGRWVFTVNERQDLVQVFDARSNRRRYSVPVASLPDTVSFSGSSAYVRARGTNKVTVVDVSRLGAADALPTVDVVAGQNAPGEAAAGSVADPVVPHHGGEVLIVNPADNYIYDYMAGMNSPMGGFKNYAPAARAAGIVDQGLRETEPGVFRARVHVSKAARYEVAFLLDEPRVVHCFSFTSVPE